MERLRDVIFHEKQEQGSMLCAQHCLNTLLQGHYFSAADLADIGRQMDALEASYDDDSIGTPSANMDDTGFFSVQVLENALGIWGLDLKRWRSAEMRAVQDHPENQLAFILNYQQHWYTIRRFGAMPNSAESAHGASFHWFNLNSYLKNPEWVSPTYLGMVLQQAETDGYSTFVVTPTRPSATPPLPRCQADDVASTIPESAMSGAGNAGPSGSSNVEGLESEDVELQAALQASLASSGSHTPPRRDPYPPPIRAAENHPSNFTFIDDEDEDPESNYTTPPESTHPVDPLEASRLRNARMLEQMQREQHMAHQGFRQNINPRHTQQAEEEEEMLRRAIAESEAMARGGQSNTEAASIPTHHVHNDAERVYDDDDPELQAALQASLQHNGWEEIPSHLLQPATPPPISRHIASEQESISTDDSRTDTDTLSSIDDSTTEPDMDIVERDVSMEEMRRMRLARFGG